MENGFIIALFLFWTCGIVVSIDESGESCTPASNPTTLIALPHAAEKFHAPGFTKAPFLYPSNADCHWILKTSIPMNKIQLTIVASSMEDRIFTDCDDFAEVYDGPRLDSPHIVQWCGDENPLHISSTTNSLYVHFQSDQYGERSGVEFSFTEYEIPGCPPGWSEPRYDVATFSGRRQCYHLVYSPYRNFTWVQAQRYCNQERANLLTINSTMEYEAVYRLYQNYKVAPWIGILDAQNEGHFENVDQSRLNWPEKCGDDDENFAKQCLPSNSHSSEDCVYINFAIAADQFLFQVDNCTTRRPFICKKYKDGSTVPYPPPEAAIRRGAVFPVRADWNPIVLWLVIAALLLVLLLILVPCIMSYCKKRQRRRMKVGQQDDVRSLKESPPKSNDEEIGIENLAYQTTNVEIIQVPVINNLNNQSELQLKNNENSSKIQNQQPRKQTSADSGKSSTMNNIERVHPVTVHPVDIDYPVRSQTVKGKGRFDRPQVHLLDHASAISMDEFWKDMENDQRPGLAKRQKSSTTINKVTTSPVEIL